MVDILEGIAVCYGVVIVVVYKISFWCLSPNNGLGIFLSLNFFTRAISKADFSAITGWMGLFFKTPELSFPTKFENLGVEKFLVSSEIYF